MLNFLWSTIILSLIFSFDRNNFLSTCRTFRRCLNIDIYAVSIYIYGQFFFFIFLNPFWLCITVFLCLSIMENILHCTINYMVKSVHCNLVHIFIKFVLNCIFYFFVYRKSISAILIPEKYSK